MAGGTLAGGVVVAGRPGPTGPRSSVKLGAAFRSGEYGVDLLAVDPGHVRPRRALAKRRRGHPSRWPDCSTTSISPWRGGRRPFARRRDRPPARCDAAALGAGLRAPGRARWHTAAFFPGYRNGATLVVVARDTLRRNCRTHAPEVSGCAIRPTTPSINSTLAGASASSGRPGQADVFDVTSFLTVRWSYGALAAAFGLLVALVVLVAQLLVLDARSRPSPSRLRADQPHGPPGARRGDRRPHRAGPCPCSPASPSGPPSVSVCAMSRWRRSIAPVS